MERVPGEDLRMNDFLGDYIPGSCVDGRPCPNVRSLRELRGHLSKNHSDADDWFAEGAEIAWLEYQKAVLRELGN